MTSGAIELTGGCHACSDTECSLVWHSSVNHFLPNQQGEHGEEAAQQSDVCLLFFSMIDTSTMSAYDGGIRLEQ